jgi:hypothetical protein
MAEDHEEDRGLLDDDGGGGGDENAALFLVGTMWIIDNRGRRKVLYRSAVEHGTYICREHLNFFSAGAPS